MSRAFKRIIVALRDVDRPQRSTLHKVATIAAGAGSGAVVELYHAINDPIASDAIRRNRRPEDTTRIIEEIATRYRNRLERHAHRKPLQALGRAVRVYANWDYPAHEAIVRRALATRADLVVAETRPHRFGARLFLANTDWELIRNCPCPLLLVKAGGSYERARVLVAVDPFHTADKPASLDRLLLQAGQDLAKQIGGQVHAFHAYLPLATIAPMAATPPVPVWIPQGGEEEFAASVRKAFDRLARDAGIPPSRRHLCLGDVPTQLSNVVRRTHARIVVMGAVSRSGLKRLFIGNTAERVLDGLGCDVLIVKPRGFQTAVPKEPVWTLGQTPY